MFRNPPIIGLDIGHHNIKAVVLTPVKEQLRLSAFAEIELPSAVINDQHSVDTSALLSAIRQLKRRLPFNARKVVLALPDSAVISKVIQLDSHLGDEEAEFAVVQSLSASAPFAVEELRLDFFPLMAGSFAAPAVTVPYQIIAARKETVDSRVEAVRQAGLAPWVMELQTHALLWLAGHAAEQGGAADARGIVDIGECHTTFSIKPLGEVAYHREIAFGTRPFRIAAAEDRNRGPAMSLQSGPAEDFTRQLAERLRRQFQLYNSTHPSAALQGIWLCGDGRYLVLEELLGRMLGLEVQWLNPFRYFPCSKKLGTLTEPGWYSQYAVATGLAIRGSAE